MKTNNQNHFTALHRILHWTAALMMAVLFITGFLRMNWMGKRTIIEAVEKGIQTPNVPLAREQTMAVAKSIIEPMWQWHEYAAYIMFFAFAIRVIYMMAKGIRFVNPFSKYHPGKERFQSFIYVIFYLFVATSIVTGSYLKWGDGQWKEPMEMVHKWAIYWFPIFILVHLTGILIGELTNKKGVVSRMIGGN